MIKFTCGNKKLNHLADALHLKKNQVVCFDLPAGWTCPNAVDCKAKADRYTGKITDGKGMKFRCYASSVESYSPGARKVRWDNFIGVKTNALENLENALNPKIKIIRIHSSGDFFSPEYFQAWVKFAENHPEIIIFGYTKIADYVKFNKPSNFKLVYSKGGKDDKNSQDLPSCYVSQNPEIEYPEIKHACSGNDTDDYDCIMSGLSFVLKVHGTQPARPKI